MSKMIYSRDVHNIVGQSGTTALEHLFKALRVAPGNAPNADYFLLRRYAGLIAVPSSVAGTTGIAPVIELR